MLLREIEKERFSISFLLLENCAKYCLAAEPEPKPEKEPEPKLFQSWNRTRNKSLWLHNTENKPKTNSYSSVCSPCPLTPPSAPKLMVTLNSRLLAVRPNQVLFDSSRKVSAILKIFNG
jgi:hypothetical protein